MYVVSVTVFVKPEFVDRFIEASKANASGARQEPGCVRFDVLRCEDDPHRFLFYEVYRKKDDLAAHQKTPHYLKWKETVADWMAQPRQGVKHVSLSPSDADW